MSISTARHISDPTTASPKAWAVGREDEAQSATFRALAWSQADDSLAEPLPYTGEEYQEHAAPEPCAAEPPTATRYRRSTLLSGIGVGFAAAAIGGLLLTVVNTDDGPTAIPVVVTQPATKIVSSQPVSATVNQGGPIRLSASARAVPPAVAPAVPPAVAQTPASDAPAPAPQALSTPEIPAPEAAPEAAAPGVTPPGAKPPVWVPPVITVPVVSVPEVTPQQVPHPVVQPDFHVPTLPDPVITMKPGTTIPAVIPKLSFGAGH